MGYNEKPTPADPTAAFHASARAARGVSQKRGRKAYAREAWRPKGREGPGGGTTDRPNGLAVAGRPNVSGKPVFPRPWSWAAAWGVVADRRAFPGRGFFRTNRSNPPGFFSRHAERSCGGVVTEAWEPRKWLERVSAETIRRDGATRKRTHRSDSPGFLFRRTNQAQGVWNDPSDQDTFVFPTH